MKTYPKQLKCLLSVPGIGAITGMALLAEIGNFERFKDPDEGNFVNLLQFQFF